MKPMHPSMAQDWPALVGLAAIFLFEMLDTSVLTVALPTIGRDLGASPADLPWVSAAYSVTFGGLLLALGAVADRIGRRKTLLVGLVLLGLTGLATAFVRTVSELIVLRGFMGAAGALTTPGAVALAFRLFPEDGLRVRALTLISSVGLIGLAVGPPVGGLVLAVAPWQTLLVVNAPVALLAWWGIRSGIPADRPEELRPVPVDFVGAGALTVAVGFLLAAPTFFLRTSGPSGMPWMLVGVGLAAGAGFLVRQRMAVHPLFGPGLFRSPGVVLGLAFKAAAGLATAGLGYLSTLVLQQAWGWSPALAALGLLPQVVVLLAGGIFVGPLTDRLGTAKAATLGALAVVGGLGVFAGGVVGGGYVAVATSLLLTAFGLRIVGVVAGMTVLGGLPPNQSTLGAALVDTVTQGASASGLALAGAILAAGAPWTLTPAPWPTPEVAAFLRMASVAGWALSAVAAALVLLGWARHRSLV